MLLKIGELAKQLNITQDALRFYEKQQLITPSSRSAAGYRLYSADNVQRVSFILSAKAVGFTLIEIQELLDIEITKDQQTCHDVKNLVDSKVDVLSVKIKEMQRIQRLLKKLSESCCGGEVSAKHCTILEALNANDE